MKDEDYHRIGAHGDGNYPGKPRDLTEENISDGAHSIAILSYVVVLAIAAVKLLAIPFVAALPTWLFWSAFGAVAIAGLLVWNVIWTVAVGIVLLYIIWLAASHIFTALFS